MEFAENVQRSLPVFRAVVEAVRNRYRRDLDERRSGILSRVAEVLDQRLQPYLQPGADEEILRQVAGGDKEHSQNVVLLASGLRLLRTLIEPRDVREAAFDILAERVPPEEAWKQFAIFLGGRTLHEIYTVVNQFYRGEELPNIRYELQAYEHWMTTGEEWEDEEVPAGNLLYQCVGSIRGFLLSLQRLRNYHNQLKLNWPYILGVPLVEQSGEEGEYSLYTYLDPPTWHPEEPAELDLRSLPLSPEEALDLILADFAQDLMFLVEVHHYSDIL